MQFAKPGANSRQMWWDTAARWTACRQGEHIPIAWNFLHGCQSAVTLILWAVSCAKMPIKRMQIPTSSWMRDHTFSWKSLESSTPSSQRCIESNQIKTTARQGESSSWNKNALCFLISSYFCHPVLKNKGDGFLGDTHQVLDVKMTFEKSQYVTIQLQAKVQKQKFKCKPGQLLDTTCGRCFFIQMLQFACSFWQYYSTHWAGCLQLCWLHRPDILLAVCKQRQTSLYSPRRRINGPSLWSMYPCHVVWFNKDSKILKASAQLSAWSRIRLSLKVSGTIRAKRAALQQMGPINFTSRRNAAEMLRSSAPPNHWKRVGQNLARA